MLKEDWKNFKVYVESCFKNFREPCKFCRTSRLLDNNAFPIFMKHPPKEFDILFILEAPNRDDTYNPSKKYLTIDPDTDPSGSFFYELFNDELHFKQDQLFVTNSVLCLPLRKKDSHPVQANQRNNCSIILKKLIENFNPLIVCPLGKKALKATSIIENHKWANVNMSDAVGRKINWFKRFLVPLYHTGSQARNPRNGRIEKLQRLDWKKLHEFYEELKVDNSI